MSEPNPNPKVACTECDWHGLVSEQQYAPSPFDETDTIYGCPSCKAIDCCVSACDEDNCWQPAACGTPTPGGFRVTCCEHQPREGG